MLTPVPRHSSTARTCSAKACRRRSGLHAFAVVVEASSILHGISESMPPARGDQPARIGSSHSANTALAR